ncbi:Lovastatin diketide synthase LovF 21 [Colletotrichum chlorophyti]|uniref:Lovastatin diketide synthase LovF 21 n=1 Tax=Colletotrichum chlorophyti TaxID=708187 RepID=A0A1Q8RWS4_9PEZI|nr:Lovastatin diketide synthase LovF 21 [Colletotrichum chlorophyti]
MSLDDWNRAVEPKVQGTWYLHHLTIDAGIELDFMVLFSGVTGQPGQANYPGANTSSDSFVKYRTGMGLACSAIAIGAVQDIRYVSQEEHCKMPEAVGAHGITEVTKSECWKL